MVAVLLLMSVTVRETAAHSVVTGDRASQLKADYPFVRFSLLAGFSVPALADTDFVLSPHAAEPQAAGDLSIRQRSARSTDVRCPSEASCSHSMRTPLESPRFC